MASPVLVAELEPLWERLRGAGFCVPYDALLQVERVLRAAPDGLVMSQLGGLLGPLLAKDPETQVRFHRIFADCYPEVQAHETMELPLPHKEAVEPREEPDLPVAKLVLPAPAQKTLLEVVREARERESTTTAPELGGPYHWMLTLPGTDGFAPLERGDVERTQLRLRRRSLAQERGSTTRLAIRPTIEGTLASAGRPRLVSQCLPRRRRVVAVVELPRLQDHRTLHYLSLLWQLDRLGVDLEVHGLKVRRGECFLLHRGSAGFVLRKETLPMPLTTVGKGLLREESVLLYCGSGEDILVEVVSRPSGRLEEVLTPEARRLARGWRRAVFLTLAPPRLWEERLAGHFECRQASWCALEALFSPTGRTVKPSRTPPLAIPELTQILPSFWTEAQVTKTVLHLEQALPKGAFLWLCACATLREVRWDLTLDFGTRLGVATEVNLLALLSLPWFCGQGQTTLAPVPAPLRRALVDRLAEPWRTPVLERALEILAEKPPARGSWSDVEQGIEQAGLEWSVGQWDNAKQTCERLRGLIGDSALRQNPVLRQALEQEEAARLAPYPVLKAYLDAMRLLPGGNFRMGSNDYDDEKPVHPVTLSPFWLGQTPVTVAVWREYCTATGTSMPPEPDWGWIDDHPIVCVSWEDILGQDGTGGFCAWVSALVGVSLTLPTEAQWEYAARGGKEGKKFPWGNTFESDKLWCSEQTSRSSTAPVYRSENIFENAFGITDLSGNVWEWCWDWYADKYPKKVKNDYKGPDKGDARVLRGGSWSSSDADYFRCAIRIRSIPDGRSGSGGFRLSSPGPRRVY